MAEMTSLTQGSGQGALPLQDCPPPWGQATKDQDLAWLQGHTPLALSITKTWSPGYGDRVPGNLEGMCHNGLGACWCSL